MIEVLLIFGVIGVGAMLWRTIERSRWKDALLAENNGLIDENWAFIDENFGLLKDGTLSARDVDRRIKANGEKLRENVRTIHANSDAIKTRS